MKKSGVTIGLYLVALLLVYSCTGGEEVKNDNQQSDNQQEDADSAMKEHKELLEEKRDELELLLSKIENLDKLSDTDTTVLLEQRDSIQLGFSYVHGSSTDHPKVLEAFNAFLISTKQYGKKTPEHLPEEIFQSDLFLTDIKELLEGKDYFSGRLPNRKSSYFPNVANAFIEAALQLRYILLVDVTEYKKGSASVVTNSVNPAYMIGTVMLYDLKEELIVEKKPFSIEGFETMSIQYDDEDSITEREEIADRAFEDKCKRYFEDKVKEMYPTASN